MKAWLNFGDEVGQRREDCEGSGRSGWRIETIIARPINRRISKSRKIKRRILRYVLRGHEFVPQLPSFEVAAIPLFSPSPRFCSGSNECELIQGRTSRAQTQRYNS